MSRSLSTGFFFLIINCFPLILLALHQTTCHVHSARALCSKTLLYLILLKHGPPTTNYSLGLYCFFTEKISGWNFTFCRANFKLAYHFQYDEVSIPVAQLKLKSCTCLMMHILSYYVFQRLHIHVTMYSSLSNVIPQSSTYQYQYCCSIIHVRINTLVTHNAR